MPPILEPSKPFHHEDEDTSLGFQSYWDTRYIPEISKGEFRTIYQYNTDPQRRAEVDTFFKEYRACERVPLVPSIDLASCPFAETLLRRKTTRQFGPSPIHFDTFSTLLRLANGASHGVDRDERDHTAPSGGGRHPLEIYPVVLNVAGLDAGLYHYHVKECALERLARGDHKLALAKIYEFDIKILENAAVVFIISAFFERTLMKYGDRGWRILFLDAGHLGENLWLSAGALGLGCAPLAGGYEQRSAEFLGVNSQQEGVLIAYAVGLSAHQST